MSVAHNTIHGLHELLKGLLALMVLIGGPEATFDDDFLLGRVPR